MGSLYNQIESKVTLSGERDPRRRHVRQTALSSLLDRKIDLQAFGLLMAISGAVDLVWSMSYPDYALKVFGATFSGWAGWMVKYQHPVIHVAIGIGFIKARLWALGVYLAYLALACTSEVVTQLVEGYHPLRTGLILVSLTVGAYLVARRHAFT